MRISELGYGKLILKEQMYKDSVLPYNQCCTVFMKPAMNVIDKNFLDMCSDKEINETTYSAFFSKPIDDVMKIIVKKYHPDRRAIFISQGLQNEIGNYFLKFCNELFLNVFYNVNLRYNCNFAMKSLYST